MVPETTVFKDEKSKMVITEMKMEKIMQHLHLVQAVQHRGTGLQYVQKVLKIH